MDSWSAASGSSAGPSLRRLCAMRPDAGNTMLFAERAACRRAWPAHGGLTGVAPGRAAYGGGGSARTGRLATVALDGASHAPGAMPPSFAVRIAAVADILLPHCVRGGSCAHGLTSSRRHAVAAAIAALLSGVCHLGRRGPAGAAGAAKGRRSSCGLCAPSSGGRRCQCAAVTGGRPSAGAAGVARTVPHARRTLGAVWAK
mmetsp:Transcript_44180/g.127594  ORF Transcript_44180/g.127594 Transcript_44180/m.127594 type:complete len:201 (+) Transcript_44180:123-725(+)